MFINDLNSDLVSLVRLYKYNPLSEINQCITIRDGKSGWVSVSKKSRGYVIASDIQRNKPAISKLIFILVYGCWFDCVSKIHYIDGNKYNPHIHNISLQFVNKLPTVLTDSLQSKENKHIQWNNTLEVWQVLITHDGKRRFYGFFYTFGEAKKAYLTYCLLSNIPDIYTKPTIEAIKTYNKSHKTSLKNRVKASYKRLYKEIVLGETVKRGSLKKSSEIGEIAELIATKL